MEVGNVFYTSAHKEKNLMESIMQSSGKHDWTGEQVRSAAFGGSAGGNFSAQHLIGNLGNDSANNLNEIVPMKLNFSNEELGESGMLAGGEDLMAPEL